MKKYILAGLLLVVVFAVWRCSTYWDRKAARIIDKECNCFNSAGISLSKNVSILLGEGRVEAGAYPKLEGYKDLTSQEKEELDKFTAIVYDTTSRLGACLEKVRKEEEAGLNNYQFEKLYGKKNNIAADKPGCRMVFFYEREAIHAARYMATGH
jgi:hypothetical protein